MIDNNVRGIHQNDSEQTTEQVPIPSLEQPTPQQRSDACRNEQEAARHFRIRTLAKRRHRIRWKRTIAFWVEALAGCATIAIAGLTFAYVHYSDKQWQAMQTANTNNERNFAATQRAAVYLGLPDGTLATFWGKNEQVAMQFRNYGASVAQDVVVQMWPIVSIRGQPEVTQHIEPYEPSEQRGWHFTGVPVPPGFPYRTFSPGVGQNRKLIDSDDAVLNLVGRVSYFDQFGKYCQSFALRYGPTIGFMLDQPPADLCDGKPHALTYFAIPNFPKQK